MPSSTQQSCLSSAWNLTSSTAWSSQSSSPTPTSQFWPAQSDYCDGNQSNSVGSCVSKACSATPAVFTSYSNLASSLCSRYASCTSAGSTGVQTITYPGGPVTWAAPGGGWGPGQNKGPALPSNAPNGPPGGFGNSGGPGGAGAAGWGGPSGSDFSSAWSQWGSAWSSSATWTGGVLTVTGCAFEGSPWFVGPQCGWNDQGGFNGWVGWGDGWKWGSTSTQTVTTTGTGSSGSLTTGTGVATVAQAISGSVTTTATLDAAEAAVATGGQEQGSAGAAGPRPAAAAGEGSIVTGMLGIAAAAVLALTAML